MGQSGAAGHDTMRLMYFKFRQHGILKILALLLVLCWRPFFLQAAPVVLPPNWARINDPHNYTSNEIYTGNRDGTFFLKLFAATTGSFLFGFIRYPHGASLLAIVFIKPFPIQYYYFDFQVVWCASRNSPVGDNSTVGLESGNLVLRNNDTSVVWSTNLPPSKSITSIEIQTTGNLVMRDADNLTLWESFSYPTDTLLPGQNLTHKMALVAGSTSLNTSEGSYKMVVESKAVVLYTTLGNPSVPQPYWISPKRYSLNDLLRSNANATKAYLSIPLSGNFSINRLLVCNKEVPCADNQFGTIHGPPIYNFLRLDYDGVIRWNYFEDEATEWLQKTMTTSFTDSCLYPTYCGPYSICSNGDPNGGNCKCPGSEEAGVAPIFQFLNASDERQGCSPPWNATSCVSGNMLNDPHSTISVLKVQNVAYFPNKYLPASAENVSSTECCNMCLHNCSCAASFFWNNSTISKCFLASEVLSMYTTLTMLESDLPESDGQYSAFIKYTKKRDTKMGLSTWKLALIISSGGLLLLIVCICVTTVVVRLRSVEEEEDDAFLESLPGLPPRFSFKELDTATNRFNKILGEGGFGSVYEGILPDGNKVAVKRLGGSKQGQKEFRAEVATIGGINHLHLVRLWGFCSQGPHRMLVYECMENGSLDRWLFHDTILNWAIRYQIAVDTAKGLSYLHHDCRHKIIHLDVKPQNILLDNQFRAKVADFGMSKLFDKEMTEVVTRMRGTPGYMAPEWLLQTGITTKCDVYSYGMVLLEIVSGRKNIDLTASIENWYFPAWAVKRMQEKAWRETMDVRLESSMTVEDWVQVKRVVMIAMWCIQDSPRVRPTMAMVVQMLEGVVEVEDPPLQYDFLAVGSRDPPVLSKGSTSSFVNHSGASQSSDPFGSPRVITLESFCMPDSNPDPSPR